MEKEPSTGASIRTLFKSSATGALSAISLEGYQGFFVARSMIPITPFAKPTPITNLTDETGATLKIAAIIIQHQ